MPTYGSWAYNLAQLFQEVTAGTTGTPTTVWRGVFGGFNDDRKREAIPENLGSLAYAERTYDGMLGITVPMPETGLTYEQYPHVLQASMGTTTASGTGTYTRAYSVPTNDVAPTLKTYTIVLGNKQVTSDVKAIPYCFVKEWEASGQAGGNWTISATWQGQRATSGTFASLAWPTVEDAIFSKTKLYIDAAGGTVGTTQKLGVLLAAKIKYESMIEVVPVGDGNNYYQAHKMGRPKITFTITYELENGSVVATERGMYENNTTRLIRLEVPGSGSKNIRWDLAAKYDKISPYEQQGESDTGVTFEGHADYSSADSLFFTTTVINTLATIP